MTIKIRCYHVDDAKFLSQLYYNTIHNVNSKDYTKKQLDAWAPSSSVQNYSGWEEKLKKIKPFIALIDDTIVGFAEFEANGHIDCFYVHHEFQGIGVGTALMRKVELEVREKLLPRIYAEVSITARPFFANKGFQLVKQQVVKIRGAKLINFVMEKYY